MQKAKVWFVLVMALALVLSLAACTQSAAPTAAPSSAAATVQATSSATDTASAIVNATAAGLKGDINGDGVITIGYDNMQETENFFQVVKKSLDDAFAKRGWKMLYAFSERDPQRMRTNIDSFVMQKADFIIDFNVVPEAGSAIADELKAKGIPFLSIDCVYKDAYFFGVNNQMAGETAGNYLVDKIKSKWNGQLDYLVQIYNESAGPEVKKRNSGAGDVIRKAFPSFDPKNEIWENVSDNDPTDAKNVITDFLTAHPDAHHIAVVSFTDDRAFAALSGIEASNRMNDVMMVSHNADATAQQHMKTTPDDAWVATICYNSNLYGEKISQVLERIFNGEKVEQMNYNTLTAVDRSNVNQVFPN